MIEYKKATFNEIGDILELENNFFGIQNESLPETKEAIEMFLGLGGECIIQYLDNKPNGYVGIIQVKYLDDRINSLSDNSPLKKIYQREILKDYKEHYFIHSWIGLNKESKGLFKKIVGRNSEYYNKKIVGFCLKSDKKAWGAYLRFSDIAGEIIDLYIPATTHYILSYPKR